MNEIMLCITTRISWGSFKKFLREVRILFRISILGLLLLTFSPQTRAEFSAECQAEGGDSVCSEAKVLKQGYRPHGWPGLVDATTLWFDTVDAGLSGYITALKACKTQEVYRWTETDGNGVNSTYVWFESWSGDLCEKDSTLGGAGFYADTLYGCDPNFVLKQHEGNWSCVGAREVELDRQNGKPEFCEGNPCNVANGNKFQMEIDYVARNSGGLSFVRSYNTSSGKWRHTYEREVSRLLVNTPGIRAIVLATRADGKIIRFNEIDEDYIPSRDVNDKLVAIRDADRKIISWQLITEEDSTEYYGSDGKLTQITSRLGLKQTLVYDLISGKAVLKSVIDAFNRKLSFKNDANGRVQSLTDPAGNVFSYGYDTLGRLESVTYPGSKIRKYHYNESAMTAGANLPKTLTGITDENNVRFATWKYNTAGNVVLSEHAGGIGRVSIKYFVDSNDARRTEVTDSAGNVRTYSLELVNGIYRVTGMDETCDSCSDDALTRGYDENGNLTSRVDRKGIETISTFDIQRNLELTRLEHGTKSTVTEWHEKFRLPTKISEFDLETKLDYDPIYGTLREKKVTDTTTQASRTWTYTYYDSTRLLKKIDGPRTDVQDYFSFEYDTQGNLLSITNALGHVTRFSLYDGNGRVGSITDPNGLVSVFTYDWRGNIKTRRVGQELTTFDYSDVGQLKTVTLPSLEVITYLYDNARRLTGIKNSTGERKTFTLDNFGNEKKVEHFDAAGAITFSNTAEFDKYHRLHKSILAGGQATTFDVDVNGDLRGVTDARMGETRFRREDGLLREITLPDQSSVKYDYDDRDILRVITNQNEVPVAYVPNALGDLESIVTQDPDAFFQTRTVDDAGNVTTKTDSRGIVTTFTYDALNRIKSISALGATGISYEYDNGSNAKAQLTKIIDESGTTTRTYNTQGRIDTVTRVFGSLSIKIRYDYDTAGRLKTLTYPSGRTVTYKYERDRIVGVDFGNTSFVSQIKYTPFAGPSSWLWGNGRTYLRIPDLNGRIEKYSFGNTDKIVKYDATGNISEIHESGDTSQYQKFSYDKLNRVTDYFTGTNSVLQEHYEYDPAGNRKRITIGGISYQYTYANSSDFLVGVAGPAWRNWQADPSGSTLTDGTHTFKLNSYRTFESVSAGNVKVSYLRNGLTQRVTKISTDGTATHFVFDENGRLLAELDQSGSTISEHIWLGAQPIGVALSGVSYYVYADHLNTPRLIADSLNRVRWKWHSNPFGSSAANANPSGLGTFSYGQRFPGQYFDFETGLHHNHFRDYDPQTGRYVQSDPLGAEGGLNTYLYALNNPLKFVDFFGLTPSCRASCKAVGATIGAAAGYYGGGAAGAAIGGSAGGAAGSIVPVVGTVTGGSAGAAAGATVGSRWGLAGGLLVGTKIGDAIGSWMCSSGDDTDGGDNKKAEKPPSRRPTKDVKDGADQAATDSSGNMICTWCGEITTDSPGSADSREFDHADPWVDTKDSSAENIVGSCRRCNRKKGRKSPEEFLGL